MSSPWLTDSEITQHCRDVYQLVVVQVTQLASYDDQNFRLTLDNGSHCVFKIARSSETRDNLQSQHQTMLHLRAHAPPWLRVSTPLGEVSQAQYGRLVRVLSWVDGSTFKSCTVKSDALLRSAGRFVGTVCAALHSMPRLAFAENADWRMELSAERYLPLVAPDDALVREALLQFHAHALPALGALRQSVVHADLNEFNVFVSAGVDAPVVSGVIDFGDANFTHTVFDVAIALAYLALDSNDPLHALCVMLTECHAVFPLDDNELAVLWFCVRARLAVSLCKSALASREQPHNADYILVSAAPARQMLAKTARVHPRFGVAALMAACGRRFPAWQFDASSLELSPLIDASLSNVHLFDLSVGQLTCAPDDVDAFRAHLKAELPGDAKSTVGVGRYLEWRDVYQSDGFRTETAATRSCHLGVDLFLPAGTPLFAMLDGRVHSIANNALPLDYGPTVIVDHGAFCTLYGHLQLESVAHLRVGDAVPRGALFARVGASNENGGWPEHVHVQIIVDMLDLTGDFVGAAAALDLPVYRQLCPNPNLLLRLPCDVEAPAVSIEELVRQRAQFTLPNMSLSFSSSPAGPINVRRGVGCYLIDEQNRRFLDCVNNVAHVGHSNAAVHAAVCRQLAILNTNSRYLLDAVPIAVASLKSTLSSEFSDAFVAFTNSGSESNDLALRLARTFRDGAIIVLNHGYHGHTAATMAVSAYKFFDQMRLSAPPDANVRVVALPGEAGLTVRDAINSCGTVCAFIHESIVGCGGQVPLPAEWLRDAYAAVRAAGGVCIADEVQTGLGRCGNGVWHAFERLGVVPDIVTFAKPLGNGMPIGAVVCQRRIGEHFGDNGAEYFNTFGGNPVCAAALTATIAEVRRLMPAVTTTAATLFALLRQLQTRHHWLVRDVRGAGLFVGIELTNEADTKWVVEFARANRHSVLLSTDGPLHNVIKIKPPLAFGETEARLLTDALDEAMLALKEARQQ
jgi:4-aminobutyrate aminotransferase-like enzyme/Ser/Thr protein kinase RdoA (MazF antagonist)